MKKTVQCQLTDASTSLDMASGALPDNFMWMPPGEHTITPLVNGEARQITIKVTAALAQRLNAQLQQLRASAGTGWGDEPFIDFNHEDGEAAAHVTELYWAGEDPKTGGIRAKVKWTAAGQDAVLGRNFRRFSPEWQLDADTLEPVGITANLGGLVNRAAFQGIAPVMARQGGSTAQGINGRLTNFMVKARDMADRKNIGLDEAIQKCAHEDPQFYRDYLMAMGNTRVAGISGKGSPRVSAAAGADHTELVAAARAMADEEKIPFATAMEKVLHLNKDFYEGYRSNVLRCR